MATVRRPGLNDGIGERLPPSASSVRGPKLVVEKGRTPVLSATDARRLFNAIDVTTVGGLRDPTQVRSPN
jgi:hypothetical protein